MTRFVDYYSPFFVVPKRFLWLLNPKVRLHVGHQHWQFWTILANFMEYYSLFWGHGMISMINEPWVRLRVGHQHRQFWPILARFLDYYSFF